MRRDNFLFSGADSFSIIDAQGKQLEAEIAGMDANRLLNSNVDDLVTYFADKYRIDVPVLDEAGMMADQKEASRDVSGDSRRMAYHMGDRRPLLVTGTEVIIEVPFKGDAVLFKVRPSTFSSCAPQGEVRNEVLIFRCWGDNLQTAQVRSEVDQWFADVKQHLTWQETSFRDFNNSLASKARGAIEHRRQKLLCDQNMMAGLGIPLKRREGEAITFAAPEVRRKLAPKLPPVTPGAYKPEPILEEAEYQHILEVIESMVKVMERSPRVFHDADEEALRTHFLVQLNGHYEGQATGETFNYQGKTDILIRSGDQNIFIAECKVWGGPAKLTESIDQLQGYLSWRDSKTALLIFNRNKDFSKVLAAIPETVKLHPNYLKEEGRRGETGFRYAFRHKDDPAKVLHMTVLAFDIPKLD
jgi:hypothetical protein